MLCKDIYEEFILFCILEDSTTLSYIIIMCHLPNYLFSGTFTCHSIDLLGQWILDCVMYEMIIAHVPILKFPLLLGDPVRMPYICGGSLPKVNPTGKRQNKMYQNICLFLSA